MYLVIGERNTEKLPENPLFVQWYDGQWMDINDQILGACWKDIQENSAYTIKPMILSYMTNLIDPVVVDLESDLELTIVDGELKF